LYQIIYQVFLPRHAGDMTSYNFAIPLVWVTCPIEHNFFQTISMHLPSTLYLALHAIQ